MHSCNVRRRLTDRAELLDCILIWYDGEWAYLRGWNPWSVGTGSPSSSRRTVLPVVLAGSILVVPCRGLLVWPPRKLAHLWPSLRPGSRMAYTTATREGTVPSYSAEHDVSRCQKFHRSNQIYDESAKGKIEPDYFIYPNYHISILIQHQ